MGRVADLGMGTTHAYVSGVVRRMKGVRYVRTTGFLRAGGRLHGVRADSAWVDDLMSLGPWVDRREDLREEGRERCRDLTPAQRAAALPDVVRTASFGIGDEAAFARGWLDEHRKLQEKGEER